MFSSTPWSSRPSAGFGVRVLADLDGEFLPHVRARPLELGDGEPAMRGDSAEQPVPLRFADRVDIQQADEATPCLRKAKRGVLLEAVKEHDSVLRRRSDLGYSAAGDRTGRALKAPVQLRVGTLSGRHRVLAAGQAVADVADRALRDASPGGDLANRRSRVLPQQTSCPAPPVRGIDRSHPTITAHTGGQRGTSPALVARLRIEATIFAARPVVVTTVRSDH